MSRPICQFYVLLMLVFNAQACDSIGTFEATDEVILGGIERARLNSEGKLELFLSPISDGSNYEIYMTELKGSDAISLQTEEAKTYKLNDSRSYSLTNMDTAEAPVLKGSYLASLDEGETKYLVSEVIAPNRNYVFQAFSSDVDATKKSTARVLKINAGPLAGFEGCKVVEAISSTEAKIEFEYPQGAEKLTIYRDNVPVYVANNPQDTYLDKGLTGGKDYIYRCEAEVGDESVSGPDQIVSTLDPYEQIIAELGEFKGCVSGVALGASVIEVIFEFPSISDGVSITRNGNEVFTSADKNAPKKFTDIGLQEGYTYQYQCRVKVGSEYIVGSNTLEIRTLSSNAPTFGGISSVTSTTTPNSAFVSWGVSTGVPASEYRIYGAPKNSTLSQVLSFDENELLATHTGSLSKVVPNIGDEIEYAFGVLACSEEGVCSGNNKQLYFSLTDSGAPTTVGATEVTLSQGKAVITAPWLPKNGGVATRQVWGRKNSDPYAKIQDFDQSNPGEVSSTLKLTALILETSTNYDFYVIDVDPSGNLSTTGDKIVSLAVTDLVAPTFAGIANVSYGNPADSAIDIDFVAIASESTNSNGASQYVIYSSVVPDGLTIDACQTGSIVATISAENYTENQNVTYTLSGLNERTKYSVCVRARDSAGNFSSNSASVITTRDITAPAFLGVSDASYNPTTESFDIVFGASTSSDIKEYKLTAWRGTQFAPTESTNVTFSANPVSLATYSLPLSTLTITGDESIFFSMEACDNASPSFGSQNCTTLGNNFAFELYLSDITPPAGFQGISSVTTQTSDQTNAGLITINWQAPADYTGYKGFRIYDVSSGSLVTLQDCDCSANHCPSAETSCEVSVDAFRTYDFHVRAYDQAGNITNYAPVEPASGSKVTHKTKDLQVPGLSSDPDKPWASNVSIGAAPDYELTWTAAGDNQYDSSGAIFYDIYRKAGSNFANTSDPEAELADANVVKKLSMTSSYSETDGLTDGVSYYYVVCARDSSGNRACDGDVAVRVVLDSVPPAVGNPINSADTGVFAVNFSVYDAISAADDLTVSIYRTISNSAETPAMIPGNLVGSGLGSSFNCSSGCTLTNQSGPVGLNYINYVIVAEDEVGNISNPSTTLSFVYDNRPVEVYSITRSSGSVDGGKRVYVTGIKFAEGMTIALGGVACTDVKLFGTELASCTTGAAGAAGPAAVVVTNSSGASNPDVNVFYNYVVEGGGSSICDDSASWGASFASGDGSGEAPYYICNETHLQNARSASNKNYKLADNIHLTTPWTGSERINLGAGYIFTGDVDSNGDPMYRVSGLDLAGTGYYVGFFGQVNGIVSNVALIDFVVTSTHDQVGGFVGYLNGSTASVKNIRLEYGSVGKNSTRANTGGLIGQVQTGAKVSEIFIRGVDVYGSSNTGGLIGTLLHLNNTVTDIDVNVNVVGTSNVGGVFGQVVTYWGGIISITNIKSSGTVIGSTSYIGGISGGTGSVVTINWSNVSSSAEVSATAAGTADYIGGLFGSMNSLQTINDCRFTGTVWGDDNVSGIVGNAGTHTFTVNNCYVAGDVTGLTSSDVIGVAPNATFSNVFFDTETTGHTNSSVGDATGKTTAEMQTESTFTDASWDFSTIWEMPTIPGYPKLQFEQ